MFEGDLAGLVGMYLPQPGVYRHRRARLLTKVFQAPELPEHLDKIIREREEMKCLANNGSSDTRALELFAFYSTYNNLLTTFAC